MLALTVLSAVGCSDATSPSSSTARHLDVLYQQACALAKQNGVLNAHSVYYPRCALLSVLVSGPASGVEPTPLQVITAGTSSSGWRGLVVAFGDTGGAITLIRMLRMPW